MLAKYYESLLTVFKKNGKNTHSFILAHPVEHFLFVKKSTRNFNSFCITFVFNYSLTMNMSNSEYAILPFLLELLD